MSAQHEHFIILGEQPSFLHDNLFLKNKRLTSTNRKCDFDLNCFYVQPWSSGSYTYFFSRTWQSSIGMLHLIDWSDSLRENSGDALPVQLTSLLSNDVKKQMCCKFREIVKKFSATIWSLSWTDFVITQQLLLLSFNQS